MEVKEIKRKIDSVRNIWKLTGALETLSALKMKKAQKIALLSRPFAQKTAEILGKLDPSFSEEKSVFFKKRAPSSAEAAAGKGNNILILVLASDKGFCGSFNHNVLKFSEKEIENIGKGKKIELLPVGKKAAAYFKNKGYIIKHSFFGIGDFGELEDIKMISDFLIKEFLGNKYQEVYLFYTNFISTFFQKPKRVKILPINKENIAEFLKEKIGEEKNGKIDFLMEPSRQLLVEEIIPQFIEYLIYQAILEGNASEHSARMTAMRNASENAEEKVGELNLVYNKARQEQITREVCEVSSAKEVLD